MKKVVLIRSLDQSNWQSCKSIVSNIEAAYRSLYRNSPESLQILKLPKTQENQSELNKTVELVITFSPDKIVFADHKPHPGQLLKKLSQYYSKNTRRKRPELLIHIYGDFPLYSPEWINCGAALKSFKIFWLCASDNQTKLLSHFILTPKDSIHRVRFPINIHHFKYDMETRRRARKNLGLSARELVVTYTGRISSQKRVQDLLLTCSSLSESELSQIRIILAGRFDDLGTPYKMELFDPGEFAQKFLCFYKSLPTKVRSRVVYLGNLSPADLCAVLNASDVYVSMSTHNDEDYGMAPAEAICTGLPAILTDWGGFSSFKVKNNDVFLAPTRISHTDAQIDINVVAFKNYLLEMLRTSKELQKRRALRAKINCSEFSIEATSKHLRKLLNQSAPQFLGFSKKLGAFTNPRAFVKVEYKYSDYYRELYECYGPQQL